MKIFETISRPPSSTTCQHCRKVIVIELDDLDSKKAVSELSCPNCNQNIKIETAYMAHKISQNTPQKESVAKIRAPKVPK